MHKLETFTKRHIRRPEPKERSRDKPIEEGRFGVILAPRNVHWCRKHLRRFLLLFGFVLFSTGVIMTILSYIPTTTYTGGKISGPIILVIGTVILVTTSFWILYKKELKSSRKEVYVKKDAATPPQPRLGNQDYNRSLKDWITYTNRDQPETSKVQQMFSASGSEIPKIHVVNAEEEWKMALAVAKAMYAAEDTVTMELEDEGASTSRSRHRGQRNMSYNSDDDSESDTNFGSKSTLKIPKKGGGPIKKRLNSEELVIEHHTNKDDDDKDTGLKLTVPGAEKVHSLGTPQKKPIIVTPRHERKNLDVVGDNKGLSITPRTERKRMESLSDSRSGSLDKDEDDSKDSLNNSGGLKTPRRVGVGVGVFPSASPRLGGNTNQGGRLAPLKGAARPQSPGPGLGLRSDSDLNTFNSKGATINNSNKQGLKHSSNSTSIIKQAVTPLKGKSPGLQHLPSSPALTTYEKNNNKQVPSLKLNITDLEDENEASNKLSVNKKAGSSLLQVPSTGTMYDNDSDDNSESEDTLGNYHHSNKENGGLNTGGDSKLSFKLNGNPAMMRGSISPRVAHIMKSPLESIHQSKSESNILDHRSGGGAKTQADANGTKVVGKNRGKFQIGGGSLDSDGSLEDINIDEDSDNLGDSGFREMMNGTVKAN